MAASLQALVCRRVAIEHVNSSVKRCCVLKDVCRLLHEGARDQVMEICCALHTFRLRLDPWLPIPEAESCEYFAENAQWLLADEHVVSHATESYVAFRPLGVVLQK